MPLRRRRNRTALIAALVVAIFFGGAVALPPGLPSSIDAYPNWTRLNIDRVTANPTGAHPLSKDVYVNLDLSTLLTADGGLAFPFPEGTVVVKEQNDIARLLISRIYVMEKRDAQWQYAFYDRRDGGDFAVTELGTANFCHACHTGASDRDFVFTSFDRR